MKNLPTVNHAFVADEMQPPQPKEPTRGYMRDSIDALLQKVKENDAIKRMERTVQQAQAVSKNRAETDYRVLVANWYAVIPPAARQRRYRSDELLLIFAGRYRDRPALRMIAAALRANGFTSHRDWSRDGRNSRYWLPPTDQ